MKQCVLAAMVAVAVAGCAKMGMGQGEPRAEAQLHPTKGNAVSGLVTFTQHRDKVVIAAKVSGLKPNAEHGFHVHEKGDCSSGDGMSAGGHFNPASQPHAHHGVNARHAGDMPNIRADASGNASYTFETGLLTAGEGSASVVGKAVVIHRDPDDYKSQPAGNSGPRLACGIVQRI